MPCEPLNENKPLWTKERHPVNVNYITDLHRKTNNSTILHFVHSLFPSYAVRVFSKKTMSLFSLSHRDNTNMHGQVMGAWSPHSHFASLSACFTSHGGHFGAVYSLFLQQFLPLCGPSVFLCLILHHFAVICTHFMFLFGYDDSLCRCFASQLRFRCFMWLLSMQGSVDTWASTSR